MHRRAFLQGDGAYFALGPPRCGNLRVSHDQMADPNAIEILASSIGKNLAWPGNSAACEAALS